MGRHKRYENMNADSHSSPSYDNGYVGITALREACEMVLASSSDIPHIVLSVQLPPLTVALSKIRATTCLT